MFYSDFKSNWPFRLHLLLKPASTPYSFIRIVSNAFENFHFEIQELPNYLIWVSTLVLSHCLFWKKSILLNYWNSFKTVFTIYSLLFPWVRWTVQEWWEDISLCFDSYNIQLKICELTIAIFINLTLFFFGVTTFADNKWRFMLVYSVWMA